MKRTCHVCEKEVHRQVRHDYMSCRCQVSSLRLLSSPSLSIASLPSWMGWHTDAHNIKSPRPLYWRTRAKFHLCANRGTTTICSLRSLCRFILGHKPPHVNGCEPNNQLLSSHMQNFAGLAQGCYQAGPTTMLTADASLSGCRTATRPVPITAF
jgi:hypothetical protein